MIFQGIVLVFAGAVLTVTAASWLTFHFYKALENDTQPWLFSRWGMVSRAFWGLLVVLFLILVGTTGVGMITERHDDYVNSAYGGTHKGFVWYCLLCGMGAMGVCLLAARAMCMETPNKFTRVTPLVLLLFVVMAIGTTTVRRGLVGCGMGYNWVGAATVTSWKALDEYSSLISLEFSPDNGDTVCQQDLYLPCDDYNWRYSAGDDDNALRFWWEGEEDDIQTFIFSTTDFVCGQDMAYVDDDGWYAKATDIMANSHTCSVAWRTENNYDFHFVWLTPWYAVWIASIPILFAAAVVLGIYRYFLPPPPIKMYDDDDCSQCSSRSRTTTELLDGRVLYSPPSIDLSHASGNSKQIPDELMP